MPRKVTFQVDADTKGAQGSTSALTDILSKLEGGLRKLGPVGNTVADVLAKIGPKGVTAAAGVAVAGAAIGAVADVIGNAVDQYATLGESVQKFSEVSGESAEQSSRTVIALKELGIDADTAAAGIFKLGKAAQETPDKLRAVGIEIGRAADGSVDLNQTLLNTVEAWQRAGSAAERDAIVYAAFGKSGTEMLPVLEANAKQLALLEAQAQTIFSAKDLAQIRQYRIAQAQLKQGMEDLGNSIGRDFLPVQLAAVNSMNESIYVQGRLADAQISAQANLAAIHGKTLPYVKALQDQYQAAKAAAEAEDELSKSMQAAATKAAADEAAQQSLFDTLNKTFDADFRLTHAIQDRIQAYKDAKDAGFKNAEMNQRLAEAIIAEAKASVAKAVVDAAANGVTLDANHQKDIEIGKLKELQKQYPALAGLIQKYIDTLNKIPTAKYTTVGIRGINPNGTGHGNLSFDDGGTVPGPAGSVQMVQARAGETFGGYDSPGHMSNGKASEIHIHIGTLIGADGPGMDRLAREILQRARLAPGK